jgi:DNA-binding NtrC family response regulator
MRSTVLILGETGTGKGLVANMIHDLSRDRARPFVHVDCAALSPGLIESELFGHERGAFTGATERRAGRFELADRGTIFLDEIGDLDGALQAKLLRVLQDHCFERVGGSRTMTMRARVIAATSRDLRRGVRDGRFRRDLYFRLNVLQLKIPPLRDRLQDIPMLVRHGLHSISARLGVPEPSASDRFYAQLATHSWPGNVRELLNALERCLVHRRVDVLDAEDLDDLFEHFSGNDEADSDEPPTTSNLDLLDNEEEIIRSALLSTGGNVSRVARRLGMPRTTLRRRVREYGLKHLIPSD